MTIATMRQVCPGVEAHASRRAPTLGIRRIFCYGFRSFSVGQERTAVPPLRVESSGEWWNDEGLKALSARDVRVAPDHDHANQMRAKVLSGHCGAWELLAWEVASERWMEPRSAAGS